MIDVIIIDDEKAALELMKILISNTKELNCIGAFTNVKEGYDQIVALNPDVVFLDIEMPHINGIDLAYRIKAYNQNIEIVFTTAYSQYAIEAFKVNATHYLLKPINEEDLNNTIQRLNKPIKETQTNDKSGIFILGNYLVSTKGRNLKWPTRKAEELFAFLIFKNNQNVDKSLLWDLLWYDLEEKKAQHNLHNTVYRINEMLKREGLSIKINYENNCYILRLDEIYCDAFEFEKFSIENVSINEENIEEYESVVALYEGDLFSVKDYVWSYGWKQLLNNKLHSMIIKMAQYYIINKKYTSAQTLLRKLLQFNPMEENAYELLLKVYFKMGDRIKLTEVYQQLETLLKSELSLKPRISTKRLYRKYLNILNDDISREK